MDEKLYYKLEDIQFIPDNDYYPSIALNTYKAINFVPAENVALLEEPNSSVRIFTKKVDNPIDKDDKEFDKLRFFTKDYDINITINRCEYKYRDDNINIEDDLYKKFTHAIKMYFKKNSVENCWSLDSNKEVMMSFIHGAKRFFENI